MLNVGLGCSLQEVSKRFMEDPANPEYEKLMFMYATLKELYEAGVEVHFNNYSPVNRQVVKERLNTMKNALNDVTDIKANINGAKEMGKVLEKDAPLLDEVRISVLSKFEDNYEECSRGTEGED